MSTSATDLGCHKYIKRECDDAKRILCMQAWQNKIYLGYGNWHPNRGPVSINYYSPDTGFGTDTVFVDDNNQNETFLLEDCINRYVVSGSELYIPGIDPMEDWDLGNFYRNDGTAWKKYRTIPNGVHNFDMIVFNGDLFAALGIGSDGFCLQRSTDNGETWVPAIQSNDIKRFNHLFKTRGSLYAIGLRPSAVKGKVYQFIKGATYFNETSWNLMPGSSKSIACVAKNGGRIYCIENGNNKVYSALPGQDGSELPGSTPDEKVYDLKRANSLLYVLFTRENPDSFEAVIRTFDGESHLKSVSTDLPSNARSMEILNGIIYLGTDSGHVYSIPDTML